MGERSRAGSRGGWKLSLACFGFSLGLVPFAGIPLAGAATTTTTSSQPSTAGSTGSAAALTLEQWREHYERDVGILADDVLVVVDDGKNAQHHDTKAKVKTTIKDCRTWSSDARQARTAAPPIPLAAAERAWASMIVASANASSDCLAALKRRSLHAAKDFQKQLKIVHQDEATLDIVLNGASAPPG
jgi:hypothetical protein